MSEMLLNDLFDLEDNEFEDKYQCPYPLKARNKSVPDSPVDYMDLLNYIVAYLIEHTHSYDHMGQYIPPKITVGYVKFLSYFCQAWHLALRGFRLIKENFYIGKNNTLRTTNNEFNLTYSSDTEIVDDTFYLNKNSRDYFLSALTRNQRHVVDNVIIKYSHLTSSELQANMLNRTAVQNALSKRSTAGYLNPDGTIHNVYTGDILIEANDMKKIKQEYEKLTSDPCYGLVNLTFPDLATTVKLNIPEEDLYNSCYNVQTTCGITANHCVTAISATPTSDWVSQLKFSGYAGTTGAADFMPDDMQGRNVPTASENNIGWLIRTIHPGIYAGISLEANEHIVSNGSRWVKIEMR